MKVKAITMTKTCLLLWSGSNSIHKSLTAFVNNLWTYVRYRFFAATNNCCPFKAARFRLPCNCRGLDARVIPPYMEANIQQGIIDTPQLHGSTTGVAQWGDVLTNLQQRFNGLSAGLGQYGFKFDHSSCLDMRNVFNPEFATITPW